MKSTDRLRELGETLVEHPEVVTSSPDLITMALDSMVEEGLLERFVTNRGASIAYGVAVPAHECEWHKPSVVKSDTPPNRGQKIHIEWVCEVSGCRKRKQEWLPT